MDPLIFGLIGVALFAVCGTSVPRNFMYLGKHGCIAFWSIGVMALFVPPILYGAISSRSWTIIAAICLGVEALLAASCFLFPQEFNMRHRPPTREPGPPHDS